MMTLPSPLATPQRFFLPSAARSSFAKVSGACDGTKMLPAYSVKTNPRSEMLGLALECNFLAEVVSPGEYELARSIGFPAERIIYNGPHPFEGPRALIAFADSIEALERYCAESVSVIAGIRYRPAGVTSRFGIHRESLAQAAEVARRCPASSVALHFHVRPEDYGDRSWPEIANDALQAAVHFEELTAKPLTHFDVGGGWTPESLERALSGALPTFLEKAAGELKHLTHMIIEPGQGIATPVEAVATRVLEVRRRRGSSEVIVDSGYPDLPKAHTFAHRIFHMVNGEAVLLPAGSDRISGSTCLEDDVLADSVRIDGSVAPEDVLVIADAGAYDASMSFAFAQGERCAV